MVIERNGDRVRVKPTGGKSTKVGRIENGILYNASSEVLGFMKAATVSVEVVDDAQNQGFQSVYFDKTDSAGDRFIGAVPASEIKTYQKVRIRNLPECYAVPLDRLDKVAKKPAGTVGVEAEKVEKKQA